MLQRDLIALYDYELSYLTALYLYLLVTPGKASEAEEIKAEIYNKRDEKNQEIAGKETASEYQTDAAYDVIYRAAYKSSREIVRNICARAKSYGADAKTLKLYQEIYASLAAKSKLEIRSKERKKGQISTLIGETTPTELVEYPLQFLPTAAEFPAVAKPTFLSILDEHGYALSYVVSQITAGKTIDPGKLTTAQSNDSSALGGRTISFAQANPHLLIPASVKDVQGINNFFAFCLVDPGQADPKKQIMHETFRHGMPVPWGIKDKDQRIKAIEQNLIHLATVTAQKLSVDGRLISYQKKADGPTFFPILLQNLAKSYVSLDSALYNAPYGRLAYTLFFILPALAGITLTFLVNPLFILLLLPLPITKIIDAILKKWSNLDFFLEMRSSAELESAISDLKKNPQPIQLSDGRQITPDFFYNRYPLSSISRSEFTTDYVRSEILPFIDASLLRNYDIKILATLESRIPEGDTGSKISYITQIYAELPEKIRAGELNVKEGTKEKAILSCQAINQYWQLVRLPTFPGHDWRNLICAAYENIIFESLGAVVTDFCRSGKDRTGMELICVSALRRYHTEKRDFPDMSDRDQRDRFAKIFAEIFLSGHFEQNADNNSPGALALKNLSEIMPSFLHDVVDNLLKSKGVDPTASLNRSESLSVLNRTPRPSTENIVPTPRAPTLPWPSTPPFPISKTHADPNETSRLLEPKQKFNPKPDPDTNGESK